MQVSEVKACFRPPGTANLCLTAILAGEAGPSGFVGLCPEFDIASQGDTVEEAAENLKEAVELFLEAAEPAEMTLRLRSRVYVTCFEARGGAA